MKALTIHNPWATLIMLGEKAYETRSWGTSFTGQIAIHAGKLVPDRAYECADEQFKPYYRKHAIAVVGDLPWGAVIATATLVHCVRMTPEFIESLTPQERELGYFAPGRYAWVLDNVQPLPQPIPAKGSLGLWEWSQP